MKTTKKLLTLLLIFAMVFSLAACGGTGDGGNASGGDTITVVDNAGNEVELPANIERVAVCDIYPIPSVLTVFFDSAEKLVAIPPQSMSAAANGLLGELYPEILDCATECVDGENINIEELMALDPQVVFYSASTESIGEQLREAGLNAVALSVNKWEYDCIETLQNWIDLFSQIWPDNSHYDEVIAKSQEMYDLVQGRVKDLSDEEKARIFVLFQYNETNVVTSGKEFFGQWWCDAIGAINVAEELEGDNARPVNMEQIYSWDPDTIMITNFTPAKPDDLYNNTMGEYDWSGITAVKNKNAFKMPLGMYRSYTPGADAPVTLLWMAKAVYPELFADIDVTAEAKAYYNEVFGIELTDDQINSIFDPSVLAGNVAV